MDEPAADDQGSPWVGSGASIGWLSTDSRLPHTLAEDVRRAWRELFEESEWYGWMIAHSDVIYDPAVLPIMWVEDRQDLRSRHTAKSFSYYVPASMFFPPADVRQVARELIHGIYTKRAAKAGIPPPPPV